MLQEKDLEGFFIETGRVGETGVSAGGKHCGTVEGSFASLERFHDFPLLLQLCERHCWWMRLEALLMYDNLESSVPLAYECRIRDV